MKYPICPKCKKRLMNDKTIAVKKKDRKKSNNWLCKRCVLWYQWK